VIKYRKALAKGDEIRQAQAAEKLKAPHQSMHTPWVTSLNTLALRSVLCAL
jgi:hypothetical protein